MKFKSLIVLCYLFPLVLLVSSAAEVEKSKEETNEDKAQEEYHVNSGYGRGGWDGYGGGGYGGPGGGWGGYNGGWGGRGGGYGGGWGGRGGGYGGGWGGRGGGYGDGWGGRGGGYGGGWGGRGRGRGRGGCSFGCCGRYRYGGCSRCCYSLTEAMAFNEQEATP